MQHLKFLCFAGCVCIVLVAVSTGWGQHRIYGKVVTVDDEEFIGLIRWDKNEASWSDLLNGSKAIPRDNIREARRRLEEKEREDSFWGIRLGRRHPPRDWSDASHSGIRFGHIQSMRPTGSNRVLLTLKSGLQVEFLNGSTDIGTDIRGIVIEDQRTGEITLGWRDIDRVELIETPPELRSRFDEVLYGTLQTRSGASFTGLVCWDVDEVFTTDILDGNERGRKRKIQFGDIAWIERYSSRSALVGLRSGAEIVLRGSNDVNSGNRGILISDPSFGQVGIPWNNFKRLEFQSFAAPFTYKDFDGGKRLYGTVFTENGHSYTGSIRWDNDEEYTWELLDGEWDDMEFDIEFGKIRTIEKLSSRRARVILLDGRSFELSGSNDVNEGNRGIFIELASGEVEIVDWDDFRRVDFTQRD